MKRTQLSVCAAVAAMSAWSAAAMAAETAANQWGKVSENHAKHRQGAALVWAGDLKKMLLIGDGVEAFDPAKSSWSEQSAAKPDAKNGIHPYYQAAYDPKTKTVYCLSNGPVLYAFSVESETWKTYPPEPSLEGLSWHMAAADGEGRIVVVGSDKRLDNVGWTRTVIFDAASAQWSTLPLPADDIVRQHRELVEATERTIDLVGRIRLAWYRDPKGVGTSEELTALVRRCEDLGKLPAMAAFKSELQNVAGLLKKSASLDALTAARAMQRRIEDAAFEQYPVPRSRRNAPLAYDAATKVFVLFGGDHEDYQMNDTWTLDLAKKTWKRMKPDLAPSPRAGHAMCYLPKSGRMAVYEGYVASGSRDYGANPWQTLNQRELWVYDAKADRWDLLGAWPLKTEEGAAPPAVGKFYGYSASWFEAAPMAADGQDDLYLAVPAGKNVPTSTWVFRTGAAKTDAAEREKLGRPANERRERVAYFRAEYCEVPDDSKPKDLSALPANQFVKLTPAPRTPASGCRQRDWGTAVWDSDRDQVVMWGGGHCVRSSSVPLHYSPAANRVVEGYDADEPYCYNGFCGPGSSVLNRQWINTHGYNLYAYDPKCKLLVTALGYLYDPERMDWVRAEPFKPPFRYDWGHVVIESSPQGAVAWAATLGNSDAGALWLFDREKGWEDLKAQGKMFVPWCDTDGMVYDPKRDRMLIGGGRSAGKDGAIWAFDFKTRTIDKLTPENPALAPANDREMAYVPAADIVVFGSQAYTVGDAKTGRSLTRVYDCAKNRYALLDAGAAAYGHSAGWMCDAKRNHVYVFTYRGDAWGMRVDPKELKLLDQPPTQ